MENLPFTYASYQQHLSQGRLMGSRCLACRELFLPPRAICRRCQGDQMEWIEMPDRGSLAAFTTIHIGPSGMIAAGFDRDNPYCSGVVDLENGIKVSARILGVDAKDPLGIKIGTPLEVEFLEQGDGEDKHYILAFRPLVP